MEYFPMSQSEKKYLSNYAYIVEYEYVDKSSGEIITDYVTVCSADEINPTEISEEFYAWFEEENMDGDRYKVDSIVSGSPHVHRAYRK